MVKPMVPSQLEFSEDASGNGRHYQHSLFSMPEPQPELIHV